MAAKLKRWRFMRVGEIRQQGDEYIAPVANTWHPIAAMLGSPVSVGCEGQYRTKRPLPKFYAKK